eukprot:CAMPEP_0171263686 /NCGR_PEP_ID=MMETSP0790-20130122/57226_1 /TAXON_ID=2925 /ORGANISM="Alexandrium catenella, Strain OF101" /LENGTH=68 /DNA_ID=CAMNT_0011732309 /DNA_START=41 /DNA_END=244 /DNA_ORIENTATION=-
MILAVPIISIIKIVASEEVNYPLGDFLVRAIEGFSAKEDSWRKTRRLESEQSLWVAARRQDGRHAHLS